MMRFLCRDDHDEKPDRCPPHDFVAAWDTMEDGNSGVIFCSACGDIRPLTPPQIGPADVETTVHTTAEDRRRR